jgi:phosphoribosyl 1,2-cyclic phosphodiesterase
MLAISLQSGSNGNCIYVEADGVRLLFDAGICGIRAENRLAECGQNIRNVDALILSHDHSDHIRFAGVYQRKYGLPVYVTPATLESGFERHGLGHLSDVRYFRAGDMLRFGDVFVQTIRTMHDGADGSAFAVSSGGRRLGILTDLGHVFGELREVVSSLDAVSSKAIMILKCSKMGRIPFFLSAGFTDLQGICRIWKPPNCWASTAVV